MKVRLSAESIEWLYSKRIFFQGFGGRAFRLKPGEDLAFQPNTVVEPYCAVYLGNQICKMGSFSYTWSPIPLNGSVGRYCSIATNVKFPGPNHNHQLLSTSLFITGAVSDIWKLYLDDVNGEFTNIQPNPQRLSATIGNDVWIGQDSSIMRDLHIGDGAVVAAGSMVTKDVAPYAIVGGNPARFLKWRFPPDVIEELLMLRWWRHDYGAFEKINLSDIGNSIRDLKSILGDRPDYQPETIKLTDMPHAGEM